MTLVLLHPLPLSPAVWSDEVTDLADECVAPDLYSFGDNIREWARAALDLAGPGRLTVVGNSVGGSCAIEMALLAPQKIEALVLSGTKAGHDPDPLLRDEALRTLDEEGLEVAWDRYWKPLFGPGADTAIVECAYEMAKAAGDTAIANGVRAFHGRPNRDGFLDSWDGPVWVVAGEYDIAPALERGRVSARRLSGGRFREVAGVGHYVPLEAPAEFCRVVTEALQV